MKKTKLLPVVACCLIITTMLLTSCGIMKKNDFSTQKYTNFKKGKTTVNLNQVNKEKKDVDLYPTVSDRQAKAETEAVVVVEKPLGSITTNTAIIPVIKNEPGNPVGHSDLIAKETKRDKMNSSLSLLKARMVNNPSTTSYNHTNGLSLFWIVILILLIIWALGLGFGLGALINILLLIALILLILWLLEVVKT